MPGYLSIEFVASLRDSAISVLDKDIHVILKSIREEILKKVQAGQITKDLPLVDGFADYFQHINPDPLNTGDIEPYSGFETEPATVIQIKTIINALYHFENVFKELTPYKELRGYDFITATRLLTKGTLQRAYNATQSITHLDFEFINLLGIEYTSVVNLLKQLTSDQPKLPEKIETLYPLCHKAGLIAGTALNQIQPNTSQLDYNFLTRFSAILPSYIEEASKLIKEYGPTVTTHAPTLNADNIKALEDDAITLLEAVNNTQHSNVILAFNLVNYISILRRVIHLSSVTLQQIGHLSTASQKTIHENMAEIKENLAKILAFADKLEDTFFLAPGALSGPVQKQIDYYYQLLAYYADKAAPLKSLATLNDPLFTQQRLTETSLRIHEAKQREYKAKKASDAFDSFFTYLQHIHSQGGKQTSHIRLIDLDNDNKRTLNAYYSEMRPYVEKYDKELDEAIRFELSTKSGFYDKSKYYSRKVKSYAPTIDQIRQSPAQLGQWFQSLIISRKKTPGDSSLTEPVHEKEATFQTYLSSILSKKNKLRQALDSEINTQKIHILNNIGIIENINAITPQILCPYTGNAFELHEQHALALQPLPTPSPKEYDAKVMFSDPDDAVKQAMIKPGDIVFIKKNEEIEVGYRTFEGSYVQEKLENKQIIQLVNTFKKEAAITIPADLEKITLFKASLRSPVKVMFSDPNDLIKQAIIQSDDILLIKKNKDIEIGYCSIEGFYVQEKVLDSKVIKLVENVTQEEAITKRTDLEKITSLVKSLRSCTKTSYDFGVIQSIREGTRLNSAQLHHLYQYYNGKKNEIENAKSAYKAFVTLLEKNSRLGITHIGSLTTNIKKELKAFYLIAQPWLISALPKLEQENFDNLIINGLEAPYDVALVSKLTTQQQASLSIESIDETFENGVKYGVLDSFGIETTGFISKYELDRLVDAPITKDKIQIALKDSLYIESVNETFEKGIKYSVLDPSGVKITHHISKDELNQLVKAPITKAKIQTTLTESLRFTLKKGQAHYDVALSSEMIPMQNDTLYVESVENVLKYNVIDPFGIKKTGFIAKKELNHPIKEPLTLEQLERSLPDMLKFTEKNGHTHPAPAQSVINIETLKLMSQHFQQKTNSALLVINKKTELLKNKADIQYNNEAKTNPAQQLNHLIKKSRYSTMLKETSSSLHKYLNKYLSSAIASQLDFAKKGIPFPDILETNNLPLQDLERPLDEPLFAHKKQLTNIKRLFNLMYSIEQATELFENADDQSYMITYLTNLGFVYNNLQNSIGTLIELYNDPHLAFLTNEYATKILTMKQDIVKFVEPYTDAAPVDSDIAPGTVKNDPLWYTLHAFMLIPERIIATCHQQPLEQADLDAIKLQTKSITLRIESVIKSSDSYFKLLLEVPSMYGLFGELSEKLELFMKTIYTVSAGERLQLLERIKTEWLADILILADQRESELGLNSLLLSDTLKDVFNTFYQGLIEPFKFPSKRHLDCISSTEDFDKRIDANHLKIDLTDKHSKLNKVSLNNMKDLVQVMNEYLTKKKETSGLHLWGKKKDLNFLNPKFMDAYKKALPILEKLQTELKDFFKEETVFPNPATVKDIENQSLLNAAKIAVQYYQQLDDAYTIELKAGNLKEQTLLTQKEEHIKSSKQYKIDYIENAFNTHLLDISNKQFVHPCNNDDYKSALKRYVLLSKNDIVAKADVSEDIQETIHADLQDKVNEFNDKYLQDYTQLNAILLALNEFHIYITTANESIKNSSSQSTVFENETTLLLKKKRIQNLTDLATDTTLSANERIKALQHKLAEKPSFTSENNQTFKMDMLTYCQFNSFCLAWLQQCILTILVTLYLYTPEHVQQYEKITKAIAPRPKGFFQSAPQHPTTAPVASGKNPTDKAENAANKAIKPPTG